MSEHHIFQGGIYWLKLPYDNGYEDRTRPYIVISNDACNRGALDINVVPLTNHPSRMDLPCNVYLGELIRPGEPTIARCSIIKTVRRDELSYSNYETCASEEAVSRVKFGIASQFGIIPYQGSCAPDGTYIPPSGGCDGDSGDLKTRIAFLSKELNEAKRMLRAALSDLREICEDSGDGCKLCDHLPCAIHSGKCLGWNWRRHYLDRDPGAGAEPWEHDATINMSTGEPNTPQPEREAPDASQTRLY